MNLGKLLELDAYYSARARIADRPGRWRYLAGLFAHSGDSWFWLFGLTLAVFQGTPYWQLRARVLVAAILITAGIVMGIKFTVRRRRPEGEWGGVYRKSDPHSFPSGHAARGAMLGVLVLGLEPFWLGVALLIWAPLMSLARVMLGVHYLSDVLAGLVIGALLGLLILVGFNTWF